MKKNGLLSVACSLFMLCSHAQNVGINSDASLPNRNAMLDVKSSNKGVLIPRMTTEMRNRIPNTQGLLVYDITTDNFWFNTGREWKCIPRDDDKHGSGDAWLIKGNSNTKDSVNFLGTTNNVPLNIRVHNQPSGRIDSVHGITFLGYRAGGNNTGGNNTAFGYQALLSNLSAGGITAMGYQSLYSNMASDVTATGYQSLYSNTTGLFNNADGWRTLYSNTTGYENSATGYAALYSNTTGYQNTAMGSNAMSGNTTGLYNTAVGTLALNASRTGNYNTAVGMGSLPNLMSGGLNTAVGASALYGALSMTANTAIGVAAMEGATGGNDNVAVGVFSLSHNSTGNFNVACGDQSLQFNTTGTNNIGMGFSALLTNVTGNNNTAMGFSADVSTDGLSNATAVGNGAIVNASNKVRIGNGAVTVIEGQVPFTTPSDGRFKFNIQEDVRGLDFILRLRPVTYQFDVKRFDEGIAHHVVQLAAYDEASRIRRTGFIAQEVEKAAQASDYDFSGIIRPKTEQDHYSLSYDAFVVPLVKAVQEQQQTIEAQNKKIAEQEERINRLEKTLNELTKNLSK